MGILRTLIEHGFPALSMAAAPSPPDGQEYKRIVDEFRQERANDFAAMADRAGRSGVRLARMEIERDAWKAYAKELERLCLAEGLELPPAPDEE